MNRINKMYFLKSYDYSAYIVNNLDFAYSGKLTKKIKPFN